MKNRCRFITLNKTKMNQQLKTSPKESTRVGLLIVGIGGNNGSTLATTMLLQQQRGIAHERLYGSVSQSGSVSDASGKVHSIKDVTEPILKDLSEFIVGGWDVRSDVSTLNDAVHNADVIPLKTQEILSKIPQLRLRNIFIDNFATATPAFRHVFRAGLVPMLGIVAAAERC